MKVIVFVSKVWDLEMMLTAAENARLFSDDDLAKIIWALAQLEAEPSVEVMDAFMCNLYSRMEKVDTQVRQFL